MRIERLELQNFRCFAHLNVELDQHFNLLVGANTSGKTTILDALNTAIGGWFLGIPGYTKGCSISQEEVRLESSISSRGRFTFRKEFDCQVRAYGEVQGQKITWMRALRSEGGRTTRKEASRIERIAKAARASRELIVLPVLCSYGTERLWYETQHRRSKKTKKLPSKPKYPSRFDGYEDCLHFEIQETVLKKTIIQEESRSLQFGKPSVILDCILTAAKNCLEGLSKFYYDYGPEDLVLVFNDGRCTLFQNLSDGQRALVTLVSDIARRAALLNDFLEDRVLEETPGIVTIDELDLHLHPAWQRRVVSDLKRTFPKVQFIVSSHSPQIIGEVLPKEILIIEDGKVYRPKRSLGMDSNSVLREIQGARAMNEDTERELDDLAKLIDEEEFDQAKDLAHDLGEKIGQDHPTLVQAESLVELLEPGE